MSYCDRAYQTAWWLDDHMVSPEGLLWDNYNGTDCQLQNTTWTCESLDTVPADIEITRVCTLPFMPNLVI